MSTAKMETENIKPDRMTKSDNMRDWNDSQRKRRNKSLIVTTFASIVEIYDDKSVAAHMVNILRSKGNVVGENKDGTPRYRDPFFLKDEEVLKIMENYKEELDLDALESLQPTGE